MALARFMAVVAVVWCGFAAAAEDTLLQPAAKSSGASITVTLLGTAPGPPVRVGRAGISTLVEAGGQRFLFDAGYKSLERIVETGMPMDAVTKLFITHLHSDHIADVPALLLLPWAALSARDVPLEVWGPAGTEQMMKSLEQAFAFDIHVRRDVDEKMSARGIEVVAHDIEEGLVYDEGGVKIKAFLVDHGPVKPSLGYRLDFAGHSVVLSGDTRPSDNLVKFSKGADLLIHEVVDADSLRKVAPKRLFEAIVAHHTTPEQAADVFRRAAPRLAVFSHAAGGDAALERTRRTYRGRVEMGYDLMVIDIGDDVTVRAPRSAQHQTR